MLTYDLNNKSIGNAQKFIDDLTNLYQDKQNELSRLKDEKIIALNKKLGENSLMDMKRGYQNDASSDIVQNSTTKKKYFVENNMVYQNYDHVFLRDHLNPDYKLKGSFMFVPIKSFFGNQIPTFWYNILIIWLFNIVLFIALYFDALKKVMSLNLFNKKTV
jgi:hypothetical protein